MDTQTHIFVFLASLLPLLNDRRNRNTAAYREWLGVLAADLAKRGIRNAIIVMREGKMFRVLAGETRRQAAILAGLEKVPVVILDRPLTKYEQDREQALENLMRRGLTKAEEGATYAGMMEETGMKAADLARDLGINADRITKATTSKHLPEDLLELLGMGEGKLGPSVAYQLGRLQSHDDMREVADKYMQGRLDRDHLVNEVNRRLGLTRKETKEKPIKVSMGGVTLIIAVRDPRKVRSIVAIFDGGLRKLEEEKSDVAKLPETLRGMNGDQQ